METADDTENVLFEQRGDHQDWTEVIVGFPADGDYQLEFINGSYDSGGDGEVGASLLIDAIHLISDRIVSDVDVTNIVQNVTYRYDAVDSPPTGTRPVGLQVMRLGFVPVNALDATIAVTPAPPPNCEPNCVACSDADNCTECADDWVLYQADCVAECPLGTLPDSGECVACELVSDDCDGDGVSNVLDAFPLNPHVSGFVENYLVGLPEDYPTGMPPEIGDGDINDGVLVTMACGATDANSNLYYAYVVSELQFDGSLGIDSAFNLLFRGVPADHDVSITEYWVDATQEPPLLLETIDHSPWPFQPGISANPDEADGNLVHTMGDTAEGEVAGWQVFRGADTRYDNTVPIAEGGSADRSESRTVVTFYNFENAPLSPSSFAETEPTWDDGQFFVTPFLTPVEDGVVDTGRQVFPVVFGDLGTPSLDPETLPGGSLEGSRADNDAEIPFLFGAAAGGANFPEFHVILQEPRQFAVVAENHFFAQAWPNAVLFGLNGTNSDFYIDGDRDDAHLTNHETQPLPFTGVVPAGLGGIEGVSPRSCVTAPPAQLISISIDPS